MRVGWVALSLLSTAVVGCTLISSLEEHRVALDAGALVDAAGLLDGEADGALDATLDATPDADPPDAGPVVPTRGCAERDATFCDDFDDGGVAKWFPAPGAGTIVVSDGGLSPPKALVLSVASLPDGGRETVKINQSFVPTTRHVRLAINLSSFPNQAEATLLAINLGNQHYVGLRAFGKPGGVTLSVDVESSTQTPLSPFLLRPTWHDIGLELTYPDGGTTGLLVTHVDGSSQSVALPYAPTQFTVELGLLVNERVAATVAIDDVTVD